MSQVVFISYASQDKNIADAVCAKLEDKKIRAWIAPRDVPAGANFADSIISAINQCKVLVLIWSQDSNISAHILNELHQAFEQGILIIPFRIQDVQPTNAMRYYIGRTQWLDAFAPPLKKHIHKLVETVQVNLENEVVFNFPGADQLTGQKETPPNTTKESIEKISQADKNHELKKKGQEKETGKRSGAVKPPTKSPEPPGEPSLTRKKQAISSGKRKVLVISLALLMVAALAVTFFLINNNFPGFIESLSLSGARASQLAALTPGLDVSTTPARIPATPIPTATAFALVPPQISQVDGMPMVYVPAGDFSMGSVSGEDDERPLHTVYLDAFWIDKTEVTNAQYAQCVAAGGCTVPFKTTSGSHDFYFWNSSFADFPVVYVDWQQARAYCLWAGRDLPSEAQWEKAARGPDGNTYPWGNDSPDPALANYEGSFLRDTTPVGSYPEGAGLYGSLDMAGNVWEWVADWYGAYPSGTVSNPAGPTTGDYRVLRGGAFSDSKTSIRSADRLKIHPNHSDLNIGFRCALAED